MPRTPPPQHDNPIIKSPHKGTASKRFRTLIDHYTTPQAVTMLFLGFSSGLPLLLVFSTLSLWLRDAGLSRSSITMFSWIGGIYTLKFLLAPFVEHLPLPLLRRLLGRRRSWLLLAQFGVIGFLLLISTVNPQIDSLKKLALFAIGLAACSAIQDIVIDAVRIEISSKDEQGILAATYTLGYRIAMILSGAGALLIQAAFDPDPKTYFFEPWSYTYKIMALLMLIGVIITLVIREPKTIIPTKPWHTQEALAFLKHYNINKRLNRVIIGTLYTGVVAPFADFFKRYAFYGLMILLLVATYRISDVLMGVLANVFYKDMGYTVAQIGTISKFYGVIATIIGTFIGGGLIVRFGILPILILGAILTATTNVLFSFLAWYGHPNTYALAGVITADNLSVGVASAAFIAYLSNLTSVSYTATQYAIFSSIMLLIPKFLAGFSGTIVDHLETAIGGGPLSGYPWFFIGTAIVGLPVIFLVIWIYKTDKQRTLQQMVDPS